jgi:hypothetical protein
MTGSRWALFYSELYKNYNYDSLNYVINVLNELYHNQISGNMSSPDPLKEKKSQMLRYEIIARFCQYAESLGAFMYGYRTNHLVRDKESKVLSTISKYQVKEISDEYKHLTMGPINRLQKNQKQLLQDIFGYHKITAPQFFNSKRDSVYNIKRLLKEVYDCYLFYQDSYNSYKHGYRLWFGRDQKTQVDAVIYIPTIRYNKKRKRYNRKRRNYVPSDDGALAVVIRSMRYCRQLFDILIENERQMRMTRKKMNLVVSFLKKINSGYVIDKQSLAI